MDGDKCLNMAERISVMETDVRNMQEGNKLFRDEIRSEVRELRKQNEAIYEIAASVKVMAQDMQGVKDDLKEVKTGQEELRTAVSSVESKDAKKTLRIWEDLRNKLIWLFVGGIAAFILYQALPIIKQ